MLAELMKWIFETNRQIVNKSSCNVYREGLGQSVNVTSSQ